MKALSVHQPYASAIVRGRKRIENRSTFLSHRGPLLIHATKKTTDHDLPTGAIVGRVIVKDCIHISRLGRRDRSATGPYCLVLECPVEIPPIPWRGSQGFFEVRDSKLPSIVQVPGYVPPPKRSTGPVDWLAIAKRYKAGESMIGLAKEIGELPQTVYRRLTQLGVRARKARSR